MAKHPNGIGNIPGLRVDPQGQWTSKHDLRGQFGSWLLAWWQWTSTLFFGVICIQWLKIAFASRLEWSNVQGIIVARVGRTGVKRNLFLMPMWCGSEGSPDWWCEPERPYISALNMFHWCTRFALNSWAVFQSCFAYRQKPENNYRFLGAPPRSWSLAGERNIKKNIDFCRPASAAAEFGLIVLIKLSIRGQVRVWWFPFISNLLPASLDSKMWRAKRVKNVPGVIYVTQAKFVKYSISDEQQFKNIARELRELNWTLGVNIVLFIIFFVFFFK